jgi:hypothetical protein
MRNEEVLHSVRGEECPTCNKEKRKVKWIGHIFHTDCFLTHVIDGKLEGVGRRGRGYKQLLNDLNERRTYWILKEETLTHTLWKTRFGIGCGTVVRLINCCC